MFVDISLFLQIVCILKCLRISNTWKLPPFPEISKDRNSKHRLKRINIAPKIDPFGFVFTRSYFHFAIIFLFINIRLFLFFFSLSEQKFRWRFSWRNSAWYFRSSIKIFSFMPVKTDRKNLNIGKKGKYNNCFIDYITDLITYFILRKKSHIQWQKCHLKSNKIFYACMYIYVSTLLKYEFVALVKITIKLLHKLLWTHVFVGNECARYGHRFTWICPFPVAYIKDGMRTTHLQSFKII